MGTPESALGQDRLTAVAQRIDGKVPAKAGPRDYLGRFREIIADPLNILIERHPLAGVIDDANMVTLHNGLKVPFSGENAYCGEFSHILALNRGVHEPLEEYVFQELLKRLGDAPTMLELGAYWGHYSMWLKNTHPAAKVILVEAEPAMLAVGRSNFTFNRLEGEFIQGVVEHGQFEVDAFLAKRKIDRLEVLHADIQGHEGAMLEGCRKALAAKTLDYLFVSTHSDKLTKRATGALRSNDYRIEVVSDFGRHTNSFDGFVFASSPRVAPLLSGFKPLGRIELAVARPTEVVRMLSAWPGRNPSEAVAKEARSGRASLLRFRWARNLLGWR